MRDTRHGKETLPSLQQAGGTNTAMKDTSSSKLAKMAKNLGNDEIQQRIDSGNAKRDELLQFLMERLHTIRDVQLREVDLCKKDANYDWWRMVGDSQRDVDRPDPTRWRDAARAYESASFHLCRGDLNRGTAEMKRAMEAEQRAFDKLTKLVEVTENERDTSSAAAAAEGAPTHTAGACAEPEGVKVAAEIYNVTEKAEKTPNRERSLDPWWTLEEDEEEEQKGDDKKS